MTKTRKITLEEYQNWLKTRDADPTNWDRNTCYAVDSFVRDFALKNFERKVKSLKLQPKGLTTFITSCVRAHYGSVETDEMLIAMDCYPPETEAK